MSSPVKWYGETTESLAGKSLQELVHIWCSADTHVNWLKGDIAAEVDKSYGDDKLGEFAGMVDENKNTLEEYRRVAKAYPPNSRHLDISWSVHQVFAAEAERESFFTMFVLKGMKTVKDAKGILQNRAAELTRAKKEKIRNAEGVITGIVSTAPDGLTREQIRDVLKTAGLESPEPTGEETEIIKAAFSNVQGDKKVIFKDDKFYPPSVITSAEKEVKVPLTPSSAQEKLLKAEQARKQEKAAQEIWLVIVNEKDQSTEAKELDTDYLAHSMIGYFGSDKARELAYAVLGIVEPEVVEKTLGSMTAHPSAGRNAENMEEVAKQS